MILLKDVLQLGSNDRRVLFELRGVGTKLLKVVNVLVTIAGRIRPHLDNASAAHMLLVKGEERWILLALFEAFEEIKQLVAIVDGQDASACDVRVEGDAWRASSPKSVLDKLKELGTINHVGTHHRDFNLGEIMRCVLDQIHVLIVLLKEILVSILEVDSLVDVVEVPDSKFKHL